jgi:UDP-N-acetylmuramoylalanine--D-glutamate ligase
LDLRGKVMLVIGLARSGCAAGGLLRRHGARVIGYDDAPGETLAERWHRDDLTGLADRAFDEIHAGGGRSFLDGRDPAGLLAGAVLSPGVPQDHPLVRELVGKIPVRGELEWAARFCAATLVAVTGTNGKSTTVELAAHLARAAGWRAEALGNVGRPLSLRADELGPRDLAVLEVSSFQLESVESFSPRVGTVLNLAPDHLDRYASLADYYRAKRRLVEQLAPGSTFVTWTGCGTARRWPAPGPTLLFGERADGADVYWRDGRLLVAGGATVQVVSEQTPPALSAEANLINATAAVATLWPLSPDPAGLAAGLHTFRGLPHRQQPVARLGDVMFVDDSKATNVAAVVAALDGREEPVVLIAGGRGKGEDYRPLRELAERLRAVIAIGEEGPALSAALSDLVEVHAAGTMDEAVASGHRLALPAGTVLLSPACASFDMFQDYRERGEAFAAAARSLGALPLEET